MEKQHTRIDDFLKFTVQTLTYKTILCILYTVHGRLTHSLTLSLTHPLTHSHPPTHSLTHSPTHPLTHSLPLTHKLTHSLTHPLTLSISLTLSLNHSPTHSLTHPLTHSPTPTHSLTPWCRVLLEKLTGLQPVKKFPTFYGTRRFITALTSARHLSLS